jgi:biopolymer transport protein ExbD/biopolymer transport protein TolR
LSGRIEKTVFVKSDRRAKYGDVVQVVDNIRNAGVDKVGLLTERLDDSVRR